MEHLEMIEEIASTTRSNGVPPDYLRCRLFTFSLADKAQRWFKSLPPASLTTWDEVKAAFLGHFYTKSRSNQLRNKISGFQQGPVESFYEAWERFKEYIRDCPHHGFSKECLLNTFYRGIDAKYQLSLDTASNGDFMTKSVEDANQLIENLAASNSNNFSEYNRSTRGATSESAQIAELKTMMAQLLKSQQGQQKRVSFSKDVADIDAEVYAVEDSDEQEEVNYMGFQNNRGFNQNFRNHPNLSYRSTNVENPQDQVYPPQQFAGKQFVQNLGANNFSGNSSVQNSGAGFFQQGSAAKQSVQNPGAGFQNFQSVQNPCQSSFQNNGQNPCNFSAGKFQTGFQPTVAQAPQENKLETMMLQLLEGQKVSTAKVDGMYNDLNNKFESLSAHVKKLDTQVAQLAERANRTPGTLPGKVEVNPKAHCNAIGTEMLEEAEHIEKHASPPSPERKYNPKVPYPVVPQHLREPISEKTLAGFHKRVKRIPLNTSFEDAWEHYHLNQFFKGTRETMEEIEALFVKARNVSPAVKKLPKIDDPGKFVVPCSISGVEFTESMCDSGSTVSLMSKTIAERLGLVTEPPKLTLEFADSSTKSPQGTINNLDVKVGNCLVPTDFQVVEMSNNSERPLILGRAFLATAGAMLDLPNQRISFANIDKDVYYKAVPTEKGTQLASCVSVIDGFVPIVVSQGITSDKSKVKEVLDGDSCIATKMSGTKAKEKLKCKRIKGDPHLMLIPQSCSGDVIEYEVKCKGTTKPFSKVRAILTSEIKEKGLEAVKGLMSSVLKLKMFDGGTCFGASSHTHPY